jgi:hypothetical protein
VPVLDHTIIQQVDDDGCPAHGVVADTLFNAGMIDDPYIAHILVPPFPFCMYTVSGM